MKPIILIPIHNRKGVTLTCLKQLKNQGDIDSCQVVIIDDGSTDGTSEAVKAQYPQIHIIEGHKNLWWTGAIELGMRYAYSKGTEYILWLNDDTIPASKTIKKLLDFCYRNPKSIAASQCYFNGSFTYGGQLRKKLHQEFVYAAFEEVVNCDALDGNLVCLPRSVIDQIGYPLGRAVPHYGGDNLYTWTAKKSGYQLCLLGYATATCPRDHVQESWSLDSKSVWSYWKIMLSPKSPFYIRGYFQFCFRYWGIRGIIPFMKPYLRLTIITILRLMFSRSCIKFVKELCNSFKVIR